MTDMEKKVQTLTDDMFLAISDLEKKPLELDDVTLRIGNRVCKLVTVSTEDLPSEKEIREEYVMKIKSRLASIKEYLEDRMYQTMSTIEAIKSEFNRKEAILEDRLKNVSAMPDVTWEYAKRGLTVSKGPSGEIHWHVKGLYNPIKFNKQNIEPQFQKKLRTPIIFLIKTKGNSVLSVSTKRIADLNVFTHYHQMSSGNDCWGYWRPQPTFNGPEDILNIAGQAQSVLEKINGESIADYNPSGLPSLESLKLHLLPEKTVESLTKTRETREEERQGWANTNITENNDVWSI